MDVKILSTIAVISFFSNVLATMIGKAARDCFHMKTVVACALIVIISALVCIAAVVLLLLALIWG